MYQFAAMLGSANMYNTSWEIENGQELFAAVADPNGEGILRIQDILVHESVSSQDVQPSQLSFQRAFLPVLGYLSSRWVVRSTLRKNVNALYGLLDHSFEEVDRVLQNCIDTCMARSSFNDGTAAVSGLQIFRVVSKCLYEYVTRFKNAVAQHPCFVTLVTKLVGWTDSWAAAILRSPAAFQDPIAVWSASGKTFAVQRMKKWIDTLFDVVELAEGSTLRRSDLGRDVLSREQHSQALLDGLQMTYDGPGIYHEGGLPRHDNDNEDISKIEVVPTHAELTCLIGPYLPANIPGARHHLPGSSMERLVDIQFRLLREELIAPIRSSLSHVLHDWEQPPQAKTPLDAILAKHGGLYKANHSGWDSVMFSIYTGVKFTGIECDVRKGLAIRLTFDTPHGRANDPSPTKRAMYWESVGKRRLMQGGLIGLLWIPPNSSAQNIRFYLGTVTSNLDDLRRSAKESADRLRLNVSFFDPEAEIRILSALQDRRPQAEGTKLLIEAPIMFESIRPFLETLKSRPPASIPFSSYISHHESGKLSSITIDPPTYVTPKFAFNLDSLFDTKPPIKLTLQPRDELSVQNARQMLKEKSRLDPSQADAMINVLTSEVSLIQGPPGTGKSFTGVELLRVLIANKIRPILLIAFTNHALDNIITHVLDKGLTTNIIRLGSRSNDETVAQYTLESILKTRPQTQADKSAGREWARMKGAQETMAQLMSKVVSRKTDEEDLRAYLGRSHPIHCNSLFNAPLWINRLYNESKDWQIASKKGSSRRTLVDFWRAGEDIDFLNPPPVNPASEGSQTFGYRQKNQQKSAKRFDALVEDSDKDVDPDEDGSEPEDWLTQITGYFAELNINGIPPIPQTNRPVDQLLQDSDVWSMTKAERQKLYSLWSNELREFARESQKAEFAQLKARHAEAQATWSDIKDQSKQDILSKADLIGCTTNGAAKLTTLLQSVAPKVLIVEEAGQVLEAHILASLVPSIEHLILIGDPLQLRPTIENYQLSMDNPRTGKIFRFDQSLMERLSSMGLPMSQLDVQRRMRPEIADLVRNTLYPSLQDHTLVKSPPSIRGMSKDVFFLDHRNAEGGEGDESASKTNTYEAKMIKDLVLYFLKQGKYTKTGDIVVLCAYLGQLAKVRKLLSSEVATVIDERDAVQLINHEDNDEAAEILADSAEEVQVAKRVLLRTVDNFQGEEGTIVILSLVRNSGPDPTSGKKIGFLKSANRANVALSRAREGLYILGNADDLLASGSKMWAGVIEQLRQNEQIGSAFPLSCSRHPGTFIEASVPGQIAIHAPDVIKSTILRTFAAQCSFKNTSLDADIRFLWLAQMMLKVSFVKRNVVKFCPAVAVFVPASAVIAKRSTLKAHQSSTPIILARNHSTAVIVAREFARRSMTARTSLARIHADRNVSTTPALDLVRSHAHLVWTPAIGDASIRDRARLYAERHALAYRAICAARKNCLAGIAVPHLCPLCAPDVSQTQVVDVIMGKQLCEIDPHGEELDEIIITLHCGHVFTVETLDGICELEDYYTRVDDVWTSIAPPLQGLKRPPVCPHCRGPIKSRRYGRVYKRADLDMSEQNVATACQRTLRLIHERIASFDGAKTSKDLETALRKISPADLPVKSGEPEEELDIKEKKAIRPNESLPIPSKRFDLTSRHVRGMPDPVKAAWSKATRRLFACYKDACKAATTTSSHVRAYEAAVATLYRQYLEEIGDPRNLPPMITPEDMALALARKHCGLPAPPKADIRFRVEACWLSFNIRFHVVTLAQKAAEVLAAVKVVNKIQSHWADMIEDIIYSIERDALMTIDIAEESQSYRQVVRSALFLMEAQYQAFSHRVDRYLIPTRVNNLKIEARNGCAKAKVIMDKYGRLFRGAMNTRLSDQTWLKDNYTVPAEAIVAKWAALITRLDGGYTPVTDAEKREIVKALMGGFLGIKTRGHFYQCPNGHAYVIGECGGAMEESRCPECNSVIGGTSHNLNASNSRALDLENIGREEGMTASPHAWGQGA
ncbi:hypothetical protein FRB90_012253 [Tulasnella sp. 427]|nr:hypothetical protein FRB90_012253 [Tulasnella sp. 427]